MNVGYMGYRVFFTNFGYSAVGLFYTVADALAYVKSKGFECTIFDVETGTHLVAWSPIGGTRDLT